MKGNPRNRFVLKRTCVVLPVDCTHVSDCFVPQHLAPRRAMIMEPQRNGFGLIMRLCIHHVLHNSCLLEKSVSNWHCGADPPKDRQSTRRWATFIHFTLS